MGGVRTLVAIGLIAWVMAPFAAGAQEQIHRLTHTGARNGQQALSPDGARLAFVSNRSGTWQVWVSRVDGSEATRITAEPDPVGWPSWGAAGDTLFYYTGEGAYRLMAVSLSDGQARRLHVGALSAFRPLLHPNDPTRLLFDGVEPGSSDHDLYVWDRRAGTGRRIAAHPGYDSDARWSPDGARVVFHSDRGAGALRTQVWVASVVTEEVVPLTTEPGVARYPAWSPNGHCVVYVREDGGRRNIWAIGVDGSWQQQLTFGDASDSVPIWPRPGTLIFTTDRFGGEELARLELGPELRSSCED